VPAQCTGFAAGPHMARLFAGSRVPQALNVLGGMAPGAYNRASRNKAEPNANAYIRIQAEQ